jgi:hypothetical protein
MTARRFVCLKPYIVKSFPKDHQVEVGEVLPLEGYLMGKDPVLVLDPEKHPPEYEHLDHCSFVIQDDELKKHFKEF